MPEDLLLQDALLDAVVRGLTAVVEASTRFMSVLVVCAPLRQGSRIYNCAVVVHRGRVLGVVPKPFLPTYREFYEARHFGSGKDVVGLEISIDSMHAPFGTDLTFEANDVPGLVIGIEIGHVDTRHPGIRTGARRGYRTPQSFRKPYYDRPRSFPRTLVSIDFSPLSCRLRVRCRWIHDRPRMGRSDVHFRERYPFS
jgi:hypothetical protein